MKDPITTVVIPTRNRLELLQEAVRSVMDQTSDRWELVVVDDASSDETPRWLTETRSPRIRSVRLEEQSERSKARNRGLAECRTPYVLFLDDDDVLRPQALEVLTDRFSTSPDVVAVVGGFVYRDEDGRRIPGRFPRRVVKRDVWRDAVIGWVAHTGRTLFKAEIVRAVGCFDPSLFLTEDRDLWLRVSRRGPALLVPEIVLEHRLHPGQWRPVDVDETELAVTRRHIESLPERDRRIAERLFASRSFYLDARRSWERGRRVEVLTTFIATAFSHPYKLVAVFLRPYWYTVLNLAKIRMIFGERGLRAVNLARRVVGKPPAWELPVTKRSGRPDDWSPNGGTP